MSLRDDFPTIVTGLYANDKPVTSTRTIGGQMEECHKNTMRRAEVADRPARSNLVWRYIELERRNSSELCPRLASNATGYTERESAMRRSRGVTKGKLNRAASGSTAPIRYPRGIVKIQRCGLLVGAGGLSRLFRLGEDDDEFRLKVEICPEHSNYLAR